MRGMALAAAAWCAIAGCDDAVDVRLIPPTDEAATTVDYSCVNHIEVMLYSNLPTRKECIAIPAGTVLNLRDHRLGGLLDVELPAGFSAIDLRGVRSDGDDCAGDTIFHGEGYYGEGWSLEVPLTRALDCADHTTAPTPARVLDLAKLVTGGADRCAAPANAELYELQLQHLFPYDNSGSLVVSADPAGAPVPVSVAGGSTLTGPHFLGAVDASCMALSTATYPGDSVPVTTCIDLPAVNLCAPAGTAELITMSGDHYAAFAGVRQGANTVSVALVWDAATGRPIAGATVRAVGDGTAFGVGYFSFASGNVTRASASGTTAAGLFAIELSAPTVVDVEAPGYARRRTVLGAASVDYPAVQAIALTAAM